MLNKVLKYDLKYIYKVLIIFYILGLMFSILTRVMNCFNDSTILDILFSVCSGITISFIFSILINNIMRCWSRFIRNVYGDESYLTHTLPITKKTIYISKFFTSVITMLTSVCIIFIMLFIAYYSKENIEFLKHSLDLLATIYNSTIIKLVLVIFLVFFLEMTFTIQAGYTGIILGYKSNDKKLVRSIIFGFIIYMLMQVVTLALIFIIGLFNKDIMNLFTTTNISNINIIKSVMIISIIIYSIYIYIYYNISIKLLKNGVNVD